MFKTDLNDSLRKGGRTAGSVSHTRLRDVLVVGEISLSLALMVGATLLMRTYASLRKTNPGIDPWNVLTMRFSLSGSKFETTSATEDLFRRVVDRTESLPAVDARPTPPP
jgi:putative ABC transport system permease protein